MAFGSRENHHSSHRAVHPVIAGHVPCEGWCTSLIRRTKVSCRRSSSAAPRVLTIDGAFHRFRTLVFPALGLSLAPNIDHFTMVRSPSFFQPRMRASWVWQRRSRVDGKDIRQVAQTEWIFLRQPSSHVSSIQSYQLCFGDTFLLSLHSILQCGL